MDIQAINALLPIATAAAQLRQRQFVAAAMASPTTMLAGASISEVRS